MSFIEIKENIIHVILYIKEQYCLFQENIDGVN